MVLEHLETSDQLTSDLHSSEAAIATVDDIRPLSTSPPTPFTIRRIPASHLSFFPPSTSATNNASELVHPSHTLPLPRRHKPYTRAPIPFEQVPASSPAYSDELTSSPSPSHAFAVALQSQLPLNTSPRSHLKSLTSLLNALPLPLGRVSFDSGTSTPTQGSEEQDHELVDVGSSPPTIDGTNRSAYVGTSAPDSKLPPDAKSDLLELTPYPSAYPLRRSRAPPFTDSHVPLKQPGREAISYTHPERNILVPEVVRTSQLQPSATMQLPLKPRRDIAER